MKTQLHDSFSVRGGCTRSCWLAGVQRCTCASRCPRMLSAAPLDVDHAMRSNACTHVHAAQTDGRGCSLAANERHPMHLIINQKVSWRGQGHAAATVRRSPRRGPVHRLLEPFALPESRFRSEMSCERPEMRPPDQAAAAGRGAGGAGQRVAAVAPPPTALQPPPE